MAFCAGFSRQHARFRPSRVFPQRGPAAPRTWWAARWDRARLWFTTGYGILNEVYYPRVDIPQIRDLGFIVADGKGFWVEVKRLGAYRVSTPAPGIPAVEIVHEHARFELRLRIVADARRDVVLIEVALDGRRRTCVPMRCSRRTSAAPATDNRAEATTHRGRRVLWAEQGPFGLALAAADAQQDDCFGGHQRRLCRRKRRLAGLRPQRRADLELRHRRPRQRRADRRIAGSLDAGAGVRHQPGVGRHAGVCRAASALCRRVGAICRRLARLARCTARCRATCRRHCRISSATSAMVLRVHQDKTYPGAMVASLSIPWGNSSDDIGGYHLVWPRDLVESAGGPAGAGCARRGRRRSSLPRSRRSRPTATGRRTSGWAARRTGSVASWTRPHFRYCWRPRLPSANALGGIEIHDMVRRALGFIARNGPATDQDRWEEDVGINAFTLATCVSALVCGASFLDEPARGFALQLADYWNARIEDWTSVRATPPWPDRSASTATTFASRRRRLHRATTRSSEFFRSRIARVTRDSPRKSRSRPTSCNWSGWDCATRTIRWWWTASRSSTISSGRRRPPGRRGTATPATATASTRTAVRSTAYGRGRAWPLLTGERGHYELLAGRDPLPYLQAMTAMTGRCGLMPEQVWDADPLPERWAVPGPADAARRCRSSGRMPSSSSSR